MTTTTMTSEHNAAVSELACETTVAIFIVVSPSDVATLEPDIIIESPIDV